MRAVTIFLSLWAAVGPVVGILVGAYLTKQWQREQWLADNRKEECRELLSAIARSSDALLEARSQVEQQSVTKNDALKVSWAEDRKCMILFQDRIFTAKRLNEHKIFTTWHKAGMEFLKYGDRTKLVQYSKISTPPSLISPSKAKVGSMFMGLSSRSSARI